MKKLAALLLYALLYQVVYLSPLILTFILLKSIFTGNENVLFAIWLVSGWFLHSAANYRAFLASELVTINRDTYLIAWKTSAVLLKNDLKKIIDPKLAFI